jgi:hypothetical protein
MFKKKKRFSILLSFLFVFAIIITVFLFLSYPQVYTHEPNTLTEGCIYSNQAYSVAIPYIREYAQENNRLILRIDISFWNSSRDFSEIRGNSSLSYPVWEVSATFAKDYLSPHSFEGYPYGVYGYSVLIWADTGQLYNKSEQGFM